jgi:hypothetical protein
VVDAPERALVSLLIVDLGVELMRDCSSIEGVDAVRCAKGQCVIGKSLPSFSFEGIANFQTRAREATPTLLVFALLEVFSSSRIRVSF